MNEDQPVVYGGIDPGVYSTTIAILDSDMQLVAYHQIYDTEDQYPRTPKENRKPGQRNYDPIPEQIAKDHRDFMKVILSTYNLGGVVTEKMEWSASHSDTQGWVHHVRGIIHATCLEMDVPFLMISPQQIKKVAAGKGNASKNEVVSAVYEEYSSFFPNIRFLKNKNHIADAIGAAKWLVADQLNYVDDDCGY